MFTQVLSLRSSTRIVALISLGLLFVVFANWRAQRVHATNFTSTQSGSWGSAATWGGAGVPGCGDDVIIANGHTVTLNSNIGGLGCNLNITINNGGTLDLGGFELNYSGNNTTFTNNGTFANSGAFNRLISANGGANFTFAGQGTYSGNLKLENFSAVWHIAANTSFTFNSATNNVNIQIDSPSVLDVTNALTVSGPASGANYVIVENFTGGGITGSGGLLTNGNVRTKGTVHIDSPVETVSGAAQAVGEFRNAWMVDTGASLSLSGNLTISHPGGGVALTIPSGANVDLAGNQLSIAVNSGFTNNGTVNNSGAFNRIVFMDNGVHAVSGVGIYSGNVGLEAFNNTTNITAGSSLTFGAPAGNTNIQVDSGVNFNFIGPGNLTLSGNVSNSGAIRFNEGGAACADASKIVLRSSVAGTQRAWTGGGLYSMTNLDVKDQAGTSTITATGSVNSGNNGANWTINECAPPDVSVAVSPSSVAEDGATNLVYTFTRTTSTSGALTVNFSVGGTATFNSDYTQSGAASFTSTSGTVTFGAGNATTTVTVDPAADSTVESDETVTLTVTSGTGYNIGSPSAAAGTITNDDAGPATVQFDSSVYLVGEGGGSAQVTITRTGNTTGVSTVDYKTTDTDTFTVNCSAKQGAAFARCDFATVVGTASFAAGETSKTFNVPIIDDSYGEVVETFGVALSNPTGATLGSASTATVSITDNETVDGPNPILRGDDPGIDFFVRQHYLDFLSREPEPGQPWSNILRNCGNQFNTDPNSPSVGCDRILVSGSFFGSPEFKDKGIYVIDFYRVSFNRLPTYLEFIPDLASLSGATAAEANAKRAALASNFVQRTEFTNAYGAMSNTTFVNTLMSGGMGQGYNLTSITTPDPANPDGPTKVTLTTTDLINRLNAATMTRAQVVRAIVQSDQITQNLEAVNAFVASQYYGYLRRTPETGGFNAWVTYLKNNPNDFRTMVNGFLNSAEYRSRFGP